MRHVLMPCVLVLSGFWFVGSAGAQQSCNAPAGTFDRVYCDAKLLIRADDEMNVAYQKLLKRLNAQGQQVLRQTQRNWMKERDSTCVGVNERWGSVVYSDCAARKTVERLNFLNDRLRECLSTGCQPSRIR